MNTNTLDKAYLEWANLTKARTAREIRAKQIIETMKEAIENGFCDECQEVLERMKVWLQSFDEEWNEYELENPTRFLLDKSYDQPETN